MGRAHQSLAAANRPFPPPCPDYRSCLFRDTAIKKKKGRYSPASYDLQPLWGKYRSCLLKINGRLCRQESDLRVRKKVFQRKLEMSPRKVASWFLCVYADDPE